MLTEFELEVALSRLLADTWVVDYQETYSASER